MIDLLFIIVFTLCLGSMAAGILVIHQMTRDYKSDFLNNYFYYLISFLSFSLYATWGQILLRYLMEDFEMPLDIINKVGYLIPVIGFPFVLVAWLMLLRLAFSIRERKMESVYVLLYFLLFLVVFLAVFIFLRLSDYSEYQVQDYGSLIITGFILLEIVLVFIFLILSVNSIFKLNIIRKKRLFKAFLRLFILSWILRYVFIPFMHVHYLFMAVFLLLFFASFLIPIFYLWKNADELFPQVRLDEEGGIDLLLFCSQNGISKRESQIVEQICLGKTNKQIADTLFISLQTVKDHTHRIYTKIGINSRMQLLQVVNTRR